MQFPLWEILHDNSENPIADYLLRNWDNLYAHKGGERLSVNLQDVLFASPHENRDEDPKSSSWYDRDLRINYVSVNGFRGIPDVTVFNNKFRGEKDYIEVSGFGLSLQPFSFPENQDKVWSLVLLGKNGSGKTSIYSAIERICVGDTSIARKHCVKADEKNAFHRNVFVPNERVRIEIGFHDGMKYECNESVDSRVVGHVDLRNFFCSESDLAMFECSGKNVTDYLDECIGLKELVDCINLLTKENNSLAEEIHEMQLEGRSEIDEFRDDFIRKMHAQNQCGKLLESLKKKRTEERTVSLTRAHDILSKLLSDFLDDDKAVELAYIEENGSRIFNGMLAAKSEPGQTFFPRAYFNNFRFKLYLISLRIAVAFHQMKTQKILFPLIFDDIFDSSDFTNRLYAKKYFEKIVRIYHELEIDPRPLQIIFFTQDEVIAEGVFSGIAVSKDSEERERRLARAPIYGDVLLGHLFPADEVTPEDFCDGFYNLYDVAKKSS